MTTHVFISYSRYDGEFARRLALSLSDAKIDVWLDIEDIPAGIKWSTAVQQGLLRSDVMLVIISPQSMHSKNVEDEWQYFLDMGKPIIPVLWKPAELHFQLSRIQHVDFHNQTYNVGLLALLTEIRRIGCEVTIPSHLERTRRNFIPQSNAHPTHVRPPTPVRAAPPTLLHKPRRSYRVYFASTLLVIGLAILGLFVSSRPAAQPQPISQSPVPTITAVNISTPDLPRIITTINTNVRAKDNTGSMRVAILRAGDKAQIMGVNESRTWWYIHFEVAGEMKEGWVSAIVVRAKGDVQSIPVREP